MTSMTSMTDPASRRRMAVTSAFRKMAVLFVALLMVAFVNTGFAAADDSVWPPVPSDADLQAMVAKAVAAEYGCSMVDGDLRGVCSDIHITKMHLETFPGDSARMNRILVGFKETTGPYSDGTYTTSYVLMWAGIGEALPYHFTAETSGPTRQAAWDTFTAQMGQWLPDWDLRGVTGRAGPTPSPDLALCDAVILVPPNLKAGDTLSPDATITSVDGAPVQGTISMIWSINGVVASSVTWDGNPATIVLQLSCQGHAQEFDATYDGNLTQATGPVPAESSGPLPSGSAEPSETAGPDESEAPEQSAAPTTAPHGRRTGTTPGLGGVGTVPGPADPLQGTVGMLVPGLLGVLAGVLLAGGGGGGGTTPTVPGGPEPTGGEPGGEGTKPGGPGGEGPKPGGPTEPAAPYESGDPATQVAIHRLADAMNRAAALKNPAMIDAISQAQADAFDADGKVIPEKMAAAWQVIRGVAGSRPGQLDPDAEISWAATDAAKAGLGAIPTALGMAGGAVVSIVKGIGSGAASAAKGVEQIGDAIWNHKMFGKGLDAEMKGFVKGAAGAEVNEANTALKDGRYLDALGAQGRGITKVIGAMGSKAWGVVREILPADEVESFTDPNASLEQKLWAVPAGAVKIAGLLLGTEAGVKPVPGIRPSATFIPSAVPGARAAEAAAAAGREAASATGAARQAAESMQARAAAAAKVEKLTADTLGGKAAPASLREGQQILAKNPDLSDAVDRAILADAGSGSVRALRQEGTLGPDAHNLITARRVERQSLAMSNAGERIAREETAGWIKAHTDPDTGLVDYAQAPRRVLTSEATEGNRGFASGAHAGSDLDRTYYLNHVSSERANQILAEECGNLGFNQDTLATHAYVARPGTLMDTSASAAAPNSDAWLRRNMGQSNSQSGYVPAYVSKDGAITTAGHVGGSRGSEALPMGERFGAPTRLTSAEAASSVAHQIEGLDAAAAAASPNISDGVKFAARAIKDGARFDGSTDAIMAAAMNKDPAQQAAILRGAGINSVAELRARLRP